MGFSDQKKYIIGECLVLKRGAEILTYPPKAGVLIFNHELTKILIVRNRYNKINPKWGLPKGHKEGNEEIFNCARRETFEETGLNILISDKNYYVKVNNSYYYIFSLPEKLLSNLKPNETKEIAEIKLVDLKTIHDNYLLNRELNIILKKKINFAKKKITKLNYL